MRSVVAAVIAGSLAAVPPAQKITEIHPGQAGSPHVKSEWAIDGASISIEYGRPYLKGRSLSSLTPPGRIWRTGADEATTLTTDRPLTVGALAVPAGRYTLYTVPGDAEWQLVINTQVGQWGTQYEARSDLGRVPMSVRKTAALVEQLTISIDDTDAGATLRIEWADVSASVPFTVRSRSVPVEHASAGPPAILAPIVLR